MATPIRVLIVEDLEDDAAALVYELKRGGYDPAFKRVDTAEDMRSALAEQTWHIILSDFSLPHFSSAAAMQVMQESGIDVPFVIVSGVIGEDAAVEAMKAGAQDYIFKGNMARLVPAVRREVLEASRRREYRELEAANRQILESQDELVRIEKLAAIGQLSGGVAHDLRTPLGAIQNSVFLLNKWVESHPKVDSHARVSKCVKTIGEQVTRANNIITGLLEYARVNPPAMKPVSLNCLIEECLSNFEEKTDSKSGAKSGVDVVLDFQSVIPTALVDVEQVKRVFINLISNAHEAMPEGGKLTISTRSADGYAEIKFADTGPGINSEDLKRIFDPLFTTKTKGTGFGLAICQQIVAKHGGTISVSGELGAGVAFTLALPLQGTASYTLVSGPHTVA